MRKIGQPLSRVWHADAIERLGGVIFGLVPRVSQVQSRHFGQLLANRKKRIERRERVLKDHRQPPTPHAG